MSDKEVREALEHLAYGQQIARDVVDRDFDPHNVTSVGLELVVDRAEEALTKIERYIDEGLKGNNG